MEELPLQKDGGDSRIRTEAAAGAKGRKIKRPKLSKIEWRQVQSAQMKKYGALGELEAPESGYVFAHDKFYLIRSYGPGNFEVIGRFDPVTQQQEINRVLEEKSMKIADDSARLLGRLMGSIRATDEDAIAIVLVLGTEENTQEFFRWCRSLGKDPTPQECFEKAVEISGLMEEPEAEN